MQLLAVLLALAAVGAPVAGAVGPGLPRGYDVTRVDSPTAGPSDTFGFGVVNGGDLNGDGEDDFITGQGTRILSDGTGAEDGEVVIVSGETGAIIRTIPAPEPEVPGTGCSLEGTANVDRCAAFGFFITPIGRNSTTQAEFTDLGSCPGGNTDADPYCDAATVGAADGVPDFAVSALFVDRPSPAAADGIAEDIGAVYVYDGATFTILKRVDMPQEDVNDLADETEVFIRQNPPARARPWYGRTVLNPAGLPPCAGNYGVPPASVTPPAPASGCPNLSLAVRRGDVNNGGSPDIVVGASAYKYEETDNQGGGFGQNYDGADPLSPDPDGCNDTAAPDVCIRSGRSYVYRGEDIVGSPPQTPLATPLWNIRNPYAQADDPNTLIINQLELFGHSVAPVGDVGQCTAAGAPGTDCPPPNASTTTDGRPEVLISAFRVDYPPTGPDHPQNYDIGVNLMIDGATGRVLQTYNHPDPQPGAIFGFTVENMPAVGNMGPLPLTATTPDVYLPAAGQDTDEYRGEGIGYGVNGSTAVNPNIVDFVRFRDPFPHTSGSFGTSAAGVGDLVGDTRNEILLGEFAGHNPPQNNSVISDVHFFDPVTGNPLQSLRDPDLQPDSIFSVGVAPLGDLNEDGFLDFVASAARHDRGATAEAGRAYIFRSNNTNPTVIPATPGGGGAGQAPAVAPRAGAGPSQAPAAPPTLANCAGGKNHIPGTPGNDSLRGSLGGDLITAATGDDVVDALAGDDCIDLGPGQDRGQGGSGNDLVLGGTGDDPAVDGSDGDDQLNGNLGDDRLNGGRGNDRVFGDVDDDRLFGGFGNDLLHGGRGVDRISGSRGRDRINGGASRDRISGGSSRDRIAGDQGNDRINGNSGNDTIRGNSGRDRLRGSTGRDRLSGGAGNDRILAHDRRRDRINCGLGRDRVVADRIDLVAGNCELVAFR